MVAGPLRRLGGLLSSVRVRGAAQPTIAAEKEDVCGRCSDDQWGRVRANLGEGDAGRLTACQEWKITANVTGA
jgi:hypothetical protein